MDEIATNINFDLPKNKSNVIKVIGVGGGGSNAINYMFQQGIVGVDFVVCNTDAQALEKSPVPIKIQLGASLTEGLGAGANPDVGRKSAQESFEELDRLLSTQTKMVFITAGMGGGTGTGAAPIIAKMARDLEILTVGIVTMPFQFEGKMRLGQAQKGLEELKGSVDSLIVINNNKLREVYGNLGFRAGFAKADEVLATGARAIAEVITTHYTQNIDLKDARTVLTNSGSAIMGSASASGVNRAQEAITKALDSPLLNDNKITGCKNVLLLIVSGTGEDEVTIDEIGDINDFIQAEAGNNTNIIMGVGDDLELGNSISVTIVATGFNSDQQHEIVNIEAQKVIHTLEDDQPFVHNLMDSETSPNALNPMSSEPQNQVVKHYLEEDEDADKKIEVIEEKASEAPVYNKNIKEQEPEMLSKEEIRNLDVIYEILDAKNEPTTFQPSDFQEQEEPEAVEQEFIFNEIPSDINEIEVIDAEYLNVTQENQISFEFNSPTPEDISSPIDSISEKREDIVEKDSLEGNLAEEKETFKIFQLDDDDTEKTIEGTEKSQLEEIVIEEIEMEFKQISEEDKDEKKAKPENIEEPLYKKLNSERSDSESEKRKENLKKFNHVFSNNLNRIEEMEKQPAYKRMGFDIDEEPQDMSQKSQTTLGADNDDIEFGSNNSFLHDNVD